MKISISTQQFCKNFILGIALLLSNSFSSAAAVTKCNYAEMASAFTTMILDIATNHYAFKNDTNKAEVLALLTATSSLTNKGLFFYNNHAARQGLGGWDWKAKDCIVNGVWGARDLVTLIANMQLVASQPPTAAAPDEALLNLAKEAAILSASDQPEESDALPQDAATLSADTTAQKSQFTYARDVIIFPVLKGLSSIAMAYTQGYVSSYSGDQARVTAAAAHSLIRLLEEHSHLGADSALSAPLLAAAFANFLWLGYEARQYELESQDVKGRVRMGYCARCRDGERKPLRILGCDHAQCTNCLRGAVQFHYETHEAQLHNVRCQSPGCNHTLTRNEIKGIVRNKPEIMQAYDHAAFNNAAYVPLVLPDPAAPVRPPRPAFVAITRAQRAAFLANRRAGNCAVCMEDKEDLQVLGCNHAYCIECLHGDIAAHSGGGSDDDGAAIDELACMDPACRQHLTRIEIGCIEHAHAGSAGRAARDAERRILDLYDTAAYNRAYPDLRPADAAELAAIARGELQICPNCQRRTHRDGGCNHMTCPCGVHFCYVCGTRYNPLINGGIGWGARACACPHFPDGPQEVIPVPGIHAPLVMADAPRIPGPGHFVADVGWENPIDFGFDPYEF